MKVVLEKADRQHGIKGRYREEEEEEEGCEEGHG